MEGKCRCGVSFTFTTGHQPRLYCSKQCMWKASQERNRIRRNTQSLIYWRNKKDDEHYKELRRLRRMRYYQANKNKEFARGALLRAVKSGKIKKPSVCEVCLCMGAIQGHHTDYTKPLLVRWLCRVCHEKSHHDYGASAREEQIRRAKDLGIDIKE